MNYILGTDVALTLADHDRAIGQAMVDGIRHGAFPFGTIGAIALWPAHPIWGFVMGALVKAPLSGVLMYAIHNQPIAD